MAIRRWDLTSFLHASDACSSFLVALVHGYLLLPAFHAAQCSVTSAQKEEIKYLSDQIKLNETQNNWSINLPVHVDVPPIAHATVAEMASIKKMGRLHWPIRITVTTRNSRYHMENRGIWNFLGFNGEICRSKPWHACSAIYWWRPRILFLHLFFSPDPDRNKKP